MHPLVRKRIPILPSLTSTLPPEGDEPQNPDLTLPVDLIRRRRRRRWTSRSSSWPEAPPRSSRPSSPRSTAEHDTPPLTPTTLINPPFCFSQDVPKALLPVANRPAISYVLDLLESSDLKDIIVVSKRPSTSISALPPLRSWALPFANAPVRLLQVVEGQEAARLVGAWISSAYLDRLVVEVS